MKKLLLLLFVFGCSEYSYKHKSTLWTDILIQRDSVLDLFGYYDYSPNGNDSIWVKSLYFNNWKYAQKLLAFQNDSLLSEYLFNSRKYDTFPQLTNSQLKRLSKQNKDFIEVIKNIKH